MRPFLPLTLFWVILGIPAAFCQKHTNAEDLHARLLTGRKKAVLAYAGASHSFTLDVPVRSSKPSDVPGFVNIDRQIVQATVVPVDRAVDLRRLTADREKEILTGYMNYELSYFKKKLKQDYSHVRTEWLTLGGKTFLLWQFDMSDHDKLVNHQIYLSTLFFDQVMDLNAPIFKKDDVEKAREILVGLARSMKTYDRKLDLEALGKKL